ncbi:hypothetical protein KC343_g1471 [Hortaea werneckii]|nr:hypothetical protein KC352_g11481 [Hortaea werneckii]KAI7571364.1 hypothetical protein KC317_g1685 [Hortaea werneckii]KAI7626160.1 hypothetical protein KC346_g1401 [Hortaea werneckii]KAI7636046.1 hypothetical protein KC343_g1471 [Hortaea werneckii]KAI7681881.1 hypothetical protein KC319_g1316 [Hortaea werneckii]
MHLLWPGRLYGLVLALPLAIAGAASSITEPGSSPTEEQRETTEPPQTTVTGYAGPIGEAASVVNEPPTQEHPYYVPAKPNGLEVEKPNMILFMPDQLRYDAVVAFGNEVAKTPNIDAFAKEGTRAISTCGYHVAYLAPRGDFYAENGTELGVNEYGFLTDQTLPDFPRGGFDIKDKNSLWNRLFYLGERNASMAVDSDEVLTRGALQWLENPPEEPWVLFLPLVFPHLHFMVEEPWFSLHDRSKMPIPPAPVERTGYTPCFYETLREQYGLHRANASVWQEVMATYYGMVSRVDDQFGRVMKETKEQGLWNQTITLFYTDHGEFLGDPHMIEK